MGIKDIIKCIEGFGTTISKEKLSDAVKRSNEKVFPFTKDPTGKYAVIRVPLS